MRWEPKASESCLGLSYETAKWRKANLYRRDLKVLWEYNCCANNENNDAQEESECCESMDLRDLTEAWDDF